MKIKSIKLCNFGSYLGENIFNIDSSNTDNKIVLIGGKNGAGKTTLFSGIRLCLYGYRAYGFLNLNTHYKREIKKIFNDISRYDETSTCYVEILLTMNNEQGEDVYELRREWNMFSSKLVDFETFIVKKNNILLNEEEVNDFENYVLNIIPPELFEMFFFDGEQIADYFLGEDGNEKIKSAFMVLCGYDVFDVLEKNFRRITYGKKNGNKNSGEKYLEAKDNLEKLNLALQEKEQIYLETKDKIEELKSQMSELDKAYKISGGLLYEELGEKFGLLKAEERLREEKNILLKKMANDVIPYIILKNQLMDVMHQLNLEQEHQQFEVLKESLKKLLPVVMKNVYEKLEWKDDEELTGLIQDEMEYQASLEHEIKEEPIFYLSKQDTNVIQTKISNYLILDKDDVILAEQEIQESILRSQKIRDEIDNSTTEGAEEYMRKRQLIEEEINNLVQECQYEQENIQTLKNDIKDAELVLKREEKKLDEELKNQSITTLSAKAISFLDKLQQRLFYNEIKKVEQLFIQKIDVLARKSHFIDKIYIDSDFNIRIFKKAFIPSNVLCQKIILIGEEKYLEENSKIHCDSILEATNATDIADFVDSYKDKTNLLECLQEIDKTRLSKGEKQVFIMALYWSIMQLSRYNVPFIIDTPFARIDTEHRANITKNFFMDLKGQVFIFSTNEEIVGDNFEIMKPVVQATFLLENVDNSCTKIKANEYFEVK